MCQLTSLSKLFEVWGVVKSEGLRTICTTANSFSLKALMKDSDCDGLPDTLEKKLLEKFRPYFKFSKDGGNDDDNRPADAKWYVSNCEAYMELQAGGSQVFFNDTIRAMPDIILKFPVEINDITVMPTDILQNGRRTNTHLKVPAQARDAIWAGASWDEITTSGNVGLYGHVVPVYVKEVPGKQLIKIEYWLFCPFNNAHAGGAANHESDWMTVQLIYDPASVHVPERLAGETFFDDADTVLPSKKIFSVIHWHHGDKKEFLVDTTTQTFEFTPDNLTIFSGLQSGDQQVMFAKEGVSGPSCHPVVYIEYGSHEFWPTSEGAASGAPNHNGDSFSFLTATPPNIGEVEFPVTTETDAAMLILRFNGYWGDYNNFNPPPPGPPLHYAWSWLPTINDPADPNFGDNRTRLEIERLHNLTGDKYFE